MKENIPTDPSLLLPRRDFLKKTAIASGAVIAESSAFSLLSFKEDHATVPIPGNGQFVSKFLDIQFAGDRPGIVSLNIDGLGLGKRNTNVMKAPQPATAQGHTYDITEKTGEKVLSRSYKTPAQGKDVAFSWELQVTEKQFTITGRGISSEPLFLNFNMSKCHTTMLGLFNDEGGMRLPALIHLPGQGSLRLSVKDISDTAVTYLTNKATADLQIGLPPPWTGDSVTYVFDVTAIYPPLPGIEGDSRFDSFKRNWLNAMQLNPKTKLLSNNAASTSCAFCYYEYADIAAKSPALADGLTALDIMKQTLENVIGGTHAYGLPAPGNFPVESSDSLPSMLIAAFDCVSGDSDDKWLSRHYSSFKTWADKILATDKDGNGLFEYAVNGNSGIWPDGFPRTRPSNWWDTIGFGHEDAYSNALSHRALQGIEKMALRLSKKEDARRYGLAAEKLKAAYVKNFYNPKTGVIGGWKSADGELHDYYFMYISGIAIHYGLVPQALANQIMDAMLAKVKEVGYTKFNMGLPGNLITVALKDYVHKDPDGHHGGGVRPDNADGFQQYENGGATGCFVYFTLAALYDLGRLNDADQILLPMLGEFEKGGFEGRGPNGKSNDWRKWDGTPMGYEGFLVDNYYTLLAVPLRQKALSSRH